MTDAVTRTLVLMRHSKAEQSMVKPDFDRELTDRGRADATAAGEWLVGAGIAPDVVLCSSAQRTRQTWDGVATGGVECDDVRFEDAIYDGGSRGLLRLVTEVDPEATTVLAIGHAPTIPYLAEGLADPDASDQTAVDRLDEGFPTSALAVLGVATDWADLAPGTATLTVVEVPRG